MKKIAVLFALLLLAIVGSAQVPINDLINIVKAEDARAYDPALETLIRTRNAPVQIRAALAAGRIGNDAAVPVLSSLLDGDPSMGVRAMAAFALGEIESIKAVDAVLNALSNTATPDVVRARAVEAAGKIAAANAKDPRAQVLGKAVIDTLDAEHGKGDKQNSDVILQGITAALRARPDRTDVVVARFLTHTDGRIRADAGNTLSRVRAKNANAALRSMLEKDTEATARANAARALGAADDKGAHDLLLDAAMGDADPRVRVSAIRSLATLNEARAVATLIERGETLLAAHKRSKHRRPADEGELLEIAAAVGRLLPNSRHQKATSFLNGLRTALGFTAPEAEIALASVSPEEYAASFNAKNNGYGDPRVASAYAQGMAQIASTKDDSFRARSGERLTAFVSGMAKGVRPADRAKMTQAMPDLMRAMAAFKQDNLDEMLRGLLTNDDLFIRAAAAELLADRPNTSANYAALKTAASRAAISDKLYDDAQLATMNALFKLDKKESLGTVLMALNSQNYVVRKRAFELLKQFDAKGAPGVAGFVESALAKKKDQVLRHEPMFGTRLGQVLNTDADYRRAVLRKNGTVKAVLRTEKGSFTIDLFPEDAPLTVDNFIKLARSRYFDGLEVHRVVPNFVMQDGDPRGDGNGGPGWSIRCEVNMVPYDRGAVGMALSGKDTGGSQWFVTHSPQPHLDGGYTVFGRVNETDMKIVDNIVRGDRIISVQIVEGESTTESPENTAEMNAGRRKFNARAPNSKADRDRGGPRQPFSLP